jgi:hypothetical protein
MDGGEHSRQDDRWFDRLAALRGPGESYSDLILRLAKG